MKTFQTSFGLVLALFALAAQARVVEEPPKEKPLLPGGQLQIIDKGGVSVGICPLKHTDVTADIAGFVARVKVKQTFHNPSNEKIEAIYAFPLPTDAAVDEMVMTVGDRRIVGQIKKREEARQIYEQAVAAGNVASLLDQERPNIFTQSVANIEPGVEVTIEIGYTNTLKYEDGTFEFSFPTVVGPRYVPGQPTGKAGPGEAPDTTQVPDASKISPPVTPPATRAGHDISLTINLNAGMPLREWESPTHPIDAQPVDAAPVAAAAPLPSSMRVKLKNEKTIPNKDFVFRYRTAHEQVQDAFLVHRDERGGFFTLLLQPPQKVKREQAVPRELIFMLDTSGSMQGYPITKAKLIMSQAISSLGPQDTFNLITFSGDTRILWDQPRPSTQENRDEAQAFLSAQQGSGGTEMMKAIDAALVQAPRAKDEAGLPEPIRVVCFMTDGYVGNDMAIIDAVKKNAGTTRVFSFGIGSSVNRFLLDGMAYAGRGEVEYVLMESQSDAAAHRFYQRIDAPVLTDITIDWGDLPVTDVFPRQIPDLFSVKPVVVHGRLKDGADAATITLRGNNASGPFERKIQVEPAADASHEALASLWARAKAQDLMMQDFGALQNGSFPEPLKNELTALGIEYRLLTQFTSFVAVEELSITKGGKPTKIMVPVELPHGVSYEGIFGEQGQQGLRPELLAAGIVEEREVARAAAPGKGKLARQAGGLFGNGGRSGSAPADAAEAVATKPSAQQSAQSSERLLEVAEERGEAEPAPVEPIHKLDETLRGLLDRIEKEGENGNLTVDGLVVQNYQVDVMIVLSDLSDATLEALEKLGFKKTGESKAVRLLTGTIDVRKLEELAKIEAVRNVEPVR